MNEYNWIGVTMRAKMMGVSIAILVCCVYYLFTITVTRSSARMETLDQDGQLAKRTTQGDMEFRLVKAGEGDIDGIDSSFQSYSSSDGVAVLFLTQILSSASCTQKEFEKRVEKAITIIEKGVKVDRDGKVIGERAVILFLDRTNSDKEMVAVLWTRKTDLLAIEAQSMDHVLAFEKKYCR
ncbi:MAG: hypothetical protein WAU45_02605 [Blastocatellia bacterium]